MSAAAARFLEAQERKRHRREWLRSLMRGAHGARARAISAVVRAPVPPPPKPRRTLAAREAAEEVRMASEEARIAWARYVALVGEDAALGVTGARIRARAAAERSDERVAAGKPTTLRMRLRAALAKRAAQ
jgi:hypothetical protein